MAARNAKSAEATTIDGAQRLVRAGVLADIDSPSPNVDGSGTAGSAYARQVDPRRYSERPAQSSLSSTYRKGVGRSLERAGEREGRCLAADGFSCLDVETEMEAGVNP